MRYMAEKFHGLVKVQHKEERNNFLHMIEAIAIDYHFAFEQKGGVEEIYTKTPLLAKRDYNIIRNLGQWVGGPISCDITFLIFQDADGKIVSAEDVVGNQKATFKVSIPQAILYTTLKKMKKQEADLMQTQSFSVQNMFVSGAFDKTSTDVKHWHGVLNKLTPGEQRDLKTRLIDALNSNTVIHKEHENVWDYIQRMGQRRPKQDKGNRLGLYPTKKIATMKQERDKKKDADKWQKQEWTATKC